MSVVIAIKDKNRVVLGSDSQVTYGNYIVKTRNKIFNISDNKAVLLGVCGYIRDAQLLQAQDNLISELKVLKNEVDTKYIVTQFYENIYNTLKHYGKVGAEESGKRCILEDEFILAVKDKAWMILGDGSTFELGENKSEDFLVIGSGTDTAKPILLATKGKKPEERIRQAIEACNEYCTGVNNEVIIKYTES